MSNEIDCLDCSDNLEFPEWLNKDDYDGGLRCKECGALLNLKFKDGKLLKYKLLEKGEKKAWNPIIKEIEVRLNEKQ